MVISVAGCASTEQRFAAKQVPAELLAQTWQAPYSLDLPQAALHRRPNVLERGDEVEVAVTTGHDARDVIRSNFNRGRRWYRASATNRKNKNCWGQSLKRLKRRSFQTCYERGIPTQPLVEVTLKRVRQQQITVLGGVTRPGVCTLPRDRSDLVSAFAVAGGLAEECRG